MVKLARVRTMRLLASVAIGAMVVSFAPILGFAPHTAALAQDGDSVSSEFRTALSPYGTWRRHPRWGEVWVYNDQTPDWRPYTRGQWIYTDEWGWYWDVGPEEYAWGWVAFHYGRWAFDPEYGWFWIPGEDWGPAWVDWRQGGDYVGWAPLPPDDFGVAYAEDPAYWCFVQPRFLLVPRVSAFFVPLRERVVIIRKTVIVNRTVIVDRRDRNRDRDRDRDRDRNRDRDREAPRGRLGVNPGIDPRIVAKATGKPVRAAKVEPAVLRGTKVDGTREVDAGAGRNARAQIRETNNVIKPAGRIEPPKALGADEKGRLNRPLKAVQDTGLGNDNRGRDNRDNRAGDNRRSNEPGNNPNLRANDQGRNRAADDDRRNPGLADQDRNRRSNDQGRSPPPPPVNVIRGGVSDNDRRAFSPPSTNERYNPVGRQSPSANERYNPVGRYSPPPPPVVRQPSPPQQVMRPQTPPPQQVMRPQAPPQQQFSQPRPPQQQPQRGGGGNNNNRQNQQQDPRLR